MEHQKLWIRWRRINDVQAERIARQAKMYMLINGELYRRREGESNFIASPGKKARPFKLTSMGGSTPTTWRRETSPGGHFENDFIGPRP
jgi:hypothetical protein